MFETILRENFSILNETSAFLPLFPEKELKVKFQIDQSYFVLCNEDGMHLVDYFEGLEDCYFQCNKENFADLLMKKVRLQKILSINGSVYRGTFRNLLLIESIFFLFKNDKKILTI